MLFSHNSNYCPIIQTLIETDSLNWQYQTFNLNKAYIREICQVIFYTRVFLVKKIKDKPLLFPQFILSCQLQ